jgi:hypothetical protein
LFRLPSEKGVDWLMKNRKIKLTEKDLHIIDVYSKKNLTDTVPQFKDASEKLSEQTREMAPARDEK